MTDRDLHPRVRFADVCLLVAHRYLTAARYGLARLDERISHG